MPWWLLGFGYTQVISVHLDLIVCSCAAGAPGIRQLEMACAMNAAGASGKLGTVIQCSPINRARVTRG